jgi:hypothetical protein
VKQARFRACVGYFDNVLFHLNFAFMAIRSMIQHLNVGCIINFLRLTGNVIHADKKRKLLDSMEYVGLGVFYHFWHKYRLVSRRPLDPPS